MVSLKEYLKGFDPNFLPIEHQRNIDILLPRLNELRSAYGKPLIVSSGYRSMEDHLRIYAQKGITDKTKIPMKSLHLSGAACDFADPNQELQQFIKANQQLMKSIGLWFEDFIASKSWVHCQIFPPKSGKMFFLP